MATMESTTRNSVSADDTTACQKLSILIPVYNERFTARHLIEKVLAAPLSEGVDRELIIVDDGSTDGTREILYRLAESNRSTIRLFFHKENRGKAAAVRTAIEHATGTVCIIQDADLEYDPHEYGALLRPILEGDADVVYGSRFLPSQRRRVLYFWHSLGNRFITLLSNLFTNLNLTDVETCYKMVRTEILKSIPIRSNRFGMEPELTAKLAKRGCRIFEVPVSYRGRTYQEGKKITWRDGVKAVATIFYFWLVDDVYNEEYGHTILHSLSKAHRFNRWMADEIRPWVGNSVLEIGAGIGNISLQLLPRDEYVVSDVDSLHLNYLKHNFATRPGVSSAKIDLEQTSDFASFEGRFDTIVCLNVLEHIRNDQTSLENIYSALRPGGRAIILVPRGQWMLGTLDVVLGHFRRYTETELVDKARAAGLTVERLFSFNRVGVFPWFLNARILRRRYFGKVQLKIFDSLIVLFRLIDRFLPWNGLSLILVARKPTDAKLQ